MTKNLALLVTFFVVLMIVGGQLLFKLIANRAVANPGASLVEQWVTWPFFLALVIYGLATMIWIWVLRYVELNAAYPIYALAFVLLPIAAHFLYQEPWGWRHLAGGVLIVAGVAVINRA